jgi:hypothetical protein
MRIFIESAMNRCVNIFQSIISLRRSNSFQTPSPSPQERCSQLDLRPRKLKYSQLVSDMNTLGWLILTDALQRLRKTTNQLMHMERIHSDRPIDDQLSERFNAFLMTQTVEYIDHQLYEKTKGQRILSKTIAATSTRQLTEGTQLVPSSSSSTSINSQLEPSSVSAAIESRPDQAMPTVVVSVDNIKFTGKAPRRMLNKSIKDTENIYMDSLSPHRLRSCQTAQNQRGTDCLRTHLLVE